MTTIGNLFYYLRVILLSALLLTVLSAYAAPPQSSQSLQHQPQMTVASMSHAIQAGGASATLAGMNQAAATSASPSGNVSAGSAPEAETSRFRETMKNFFGPNLNVKLRQ